MSKCVSEVMKLRSVCLRRSVNGWHRPCVNPSRDLSVCQEGETCIQRDERSLKRTHELRKILPKYPLFREERFVRLHKQRLSGEVDSLEILGMERIDPPWCPQSSTRASPKNPRPRILEAVVAVTISHPSTACPWRCAKFLDGAGTAEADSAVQM